MDVAGTGEPEAEPCSLFVKRKHSKCLWGIRDTLGPYLGLSPRLLRRREKGLEEGQFSSSIISMLLKTSQNYLKHAPNHLVCPYFKNQWHRETNILVPVVKAGLMSAEWTSQGPYGRVMSSSLPKEQQDSWALSLGISFYNLQSKLFLSIPGSQPSEAHKTPM